jgi:hypothetical protein
MDFDYDDNDFDSHCDFEDNEFNNLATLVKIYGGLWGLASPKMYDI